MDISYSARPPIGYVMFYKHAFLYVRTHTSAFEIKTDVVTEQLYRSLGVSGGVKKNNKKNPKTTRGRNRDRNQSCGHESQRYRRVNIQYCLQDAQIVRAGMSAGPTPVSRDRHMG